MKSKQRMKLSSRITTMLMSCAVVFALVLVIGIGGAEKAYAETLIDSGRSWGVSWQIVDEGENNIVLKLGNENEEETAVKDVLSDEDKQAIRDVAMGLAVVNPPNISAGTGELPGTARGGWDWLVYDSQITSVKIIGSLKMKGSMAYMFSGLEKATAFEGLDKIDTSEVTNMVSLFGYSRVDDDGKWQNYGCSSIKSLDLSTWDTGNALNMYGMFRFCRALESLDLTGKFDTSSSYYLSHMFQGCNNLKEIKGIEEFNTGNTIIMNQMFEACSGMESLDLSKWDTSNARGMQAVFRSCTNLKELKVEFDTGNVETMSEMFSGCSALENVDLSSFDMSNVEDKDNMFTGCSNFGTFKVWDGFTTEDMSDFRGFFKGWKREDIIAYLPKLDTRNATNMFEMFMDTDITNDDLKEILKKLDISKVTNMSGMFKNCTSLTSVEFGDEFDTSNVTRMDGMFHGCSALTSLDVSGFNTSSVVNMGSMFRDCRALESLDLSMFDMSNVKNKDLMLEGCWKLGTFKMWEGFTTEDISDFTQFFRGWKREDIMAYLPKLDTRNATIMYEMFRGTDITSDDLKEILKKLETGKVTNMTGMFSQCTSLTSVKFEGEFDTSKVTQMVSMFTTCSALEELDIVNFDTSNVTHMTNMFMNCGELKSTDMLGFEFDSVGTVAGHNANDMLKNCDKLADSLENITIPAVETNTSDYVPGTADKLRAAKTKLETLMAANPALSGDELIAALKAISNDYVWKTAQDNVRNAASAIVDAENAENAAQAARAEADRTGDAADIKAAQVAARKADSAVRYAVNQKALAERNVARAKLTDTSDELQDIEGEIDPEDKLDDIVDDSEERHEREAAEAEAKKAADIALGVVAIAAEKTKAAMDAAEAEKDGATKENLTKAKGALSSVQSELDKLKEQKALLTEKLENAQPGSNEERILQNALDAVNDQIDITDNAVKDIDGIVKKLDGVVKAISGADKAAADAVSAITQAKADADKVKDGSTQEDADAANGALKAAQDVIPALEAAKNVLNAQLEANPSADQRTALETALGKVEAEIDNANRAITDISAIVSGIEGRINTSNAADKALDDAKGALKEAKDAKAVADGVAASSPGSDAAVKAAEEATAKADAAVKAADAAVKAAENTGDQTKIDAAKALKAETDKAKADAAKLEAEQKLKRAEANPTEENKKSAEEAGQRALDDAKKAYGENSPEAQAAQAALDAAKNITPINPGEKFTVAKQNYVVLTVPANGNPEVALVKAKNAKSVTVPKTVAYKGKTCDVTKINKKAFYKKTRKVTVGANVDTIAKQAFKGSKVATVVLKTKDLTKKSVKASLKGSKVKTVQVKVGSKKVNKKYVKKYKKIFTKKNAGKKVTVK